MKKLMMTACLISLSLGAAACARTPHPEGMPGPAMTFQNYEPLRLNVQDVVVESTYNPAADPKDISTQFVMRPDDALKSYGTRRFTAKGVSGHFTMTIEDARVYQKELPQDNRVLKWSGVGQEDEYEVNTRVKISPVPDGAIQAPSTTIKITRTLVMPSKVSLAEREMRQTEFLEKLIRDIDSQIVKTLNDMPGLL